MNTTDKPAEPSLIDGAVAGAFDHITREAVEKLILGAIATIVAHGGDAAEAEHLCRAYAALSGREAIVARGSTFSINLGGDSPDAIAKRVAEIIRGAEMASGAADAVE